jgi:hypothetical protein
MHPWARTSLSHIGKKSQIKVRRNKQWPKNEGCKISAVAQHTDLVSLGEVLYSDNIHEQSDSGIYVVITIIYLVLCFLAVGRSDAYGPNGHLLCVCWDHNNDTWPL